MPPRTNPHSIRAVGPVSLGDDLTTRRTVSQLVQDALTADDHRAGWLDRQKALSALRYGLRPKEKSWPFRGASNLSVPLIDSTIRKQKPLFMRLLIEADPIVEFIADDPAATDAERDAEELYNWIFHTEMDAAEPMAYAIDYLLHRGFAFIQAFWDYRSELEVRMIHVPEIFNGQVPQDPNQIRQFLVRQYDLNVTDRKVRRALDQAVQRIQNGEEWVRIAFRNVVRDRPGIIDRDPVQVLMPPRTTNVEDAEWLIIQHVLSLRTLEQMEADGHFPDGSVRKIRDQMQRSEQVRQGREPADETTLTRGMQSWKELEDRRQQIFGGEDDGNILLFEVFHWHDIDGDGLADRVHTWLHPRSNTHLVTRPYLFPFHHWPVIKFDFEKTSRRWHAPRGISAMLEGLQREANAQHNARIDGMTLRNAPTFQIPAVAGFKARNYRVIPGTVIQTPPGGRLEPLFQDRSAFPEQVAEEQAVRSIAEGYIGTLDTVLSDRLNPNKARTATEVQAATQFAGSVASFDAILFQLSMRKVHEMIWKLWLELGPPETHVKVMGQDGIPTSKIIRKADIDRSYKLVPTGTIANTNRALELAHAREALQLFINDQSGLVNPFELRRWYFTLLDYRRARKVMNNPEQAQELQVLRQAAAELQQNPELQAQISGEVFDVPQEEIERQQTEQEPRQPANRF